MAVERFKTQVLILHSETKVLDACRSFFGDDYTVHLAQSGREALSMLGETPIDFFVCAEDLPGMSGSEALRAAKKTSPNTQGILLAPRHSSSAEIEALANAKDFAAVLSGSAGPAEIRKIVIEAGRSQRIASLQKSANDSSYPAANEPEEHISTTGNMRGRAPTPARRFDDDNPLTDTQPDVARQSMPNAGQRIAAGGNQVEVLVLTQDEAFFRAISNATRGNHAIHKASNLQEAIVKIGEGRVGVLVTDAAVAPTDVQIITTRLRQVQASLVTIVAGRRDDGDAMMGLISENIIYRFLLKPVSPGRARLALEASVKKSIEYRENPPPPPTPPPTASAIMKRSSVIMDFVLDDHGGSDRGRLIGIGAALLAVVAIAGFWLMSGDDDKDAVATKTTENLESVAASAPAPKPQSAKPKTAAKPKATPVVEPEPAADLDDKRFAELRRDAARAVSDGRIAEPENNNALTLYRQVLDGDADMPGVREEFDLALAEALRATEDALLNSRLDDAAVLLARIREVEPFQARLPFLEAQLRKEQRRTIVSEARAIAAAGDPDAAMEILDNEDLFSAVSDPAVVAAREEVLASRDQRELTQLLELAGQRLSEQKLVRPGRDSARFYYQAVLARDPQNSAAAQGLKLVAAALLRDAEVALANGNTDIANSLLDTAQASGANRRDVQRLRDRVEQSIAKSLQQAEIVKEQASVAEVNDAVQSQSVATEANDTAATLATELPMLNQTELVRTRYVQPSYPRAAVRRGKSGWVKFEFSVGTDGKVSNIEVIDSEPGTLFVRAGTRALSQWEYEPYMENGAAIERRTTMRMQFSLSQ